MIPFSFSHKTYIYSFWVFHHVVSMKINIFLSYLLKTDQEINLHICYRSHTVLHTPTHYSMWFVTYVNLILSSSQKRHLSSATVWYANEAMKRAKQWANQTRPFAKNTDYKVAKMLTQYYRTKTFLNWICAFKEIILLYYVQPTLYGK